MGVCDNMWSINRWRIDVVHESCRILFPMVSERGNVPKPAQKIIL